MKKNSQDSHMGETARTALLAGGFLAFVMFMSYLYWFVF